MGWLSSLWIVPTSTLQHTVYDRRQPSRTELELIHASEQQPHGGIERDRQNSRDRHGKRLGEGQRLEQAAFLRFKREHRQEGDGDDEQREEAGSPDFLYGRDHDLVIVARTPFRIPVLQLLVCLLDNYDGRINHGSDSDSVSAERHDIGRHAAHLNRNKRQDHGYRNSNDGNDGTGEVPQKDHDHQADDDQLFNERVFQVID